MSLKFVVFDAEIGNPLYNIPSGTALLFGGGGGLGKHSCGSTSPIGEQIRNVQNLLTA